MGYTDDNVEMSN